MADSLVRASFAQADDVQISQSQNLRRLEHPLSFGRPRQPFASDARSPETRAEPHGLLDQPRLGRPLETLTDVGYKFADGVWALEVVAPTGVVTGSVAP